MRRHAVCALLIAASPAQAACPDMATVARFAEAILERRSPQPYADLTLADARCAQDRLIAFLAQPWGDVVGHAVMVGPGGPLHGVLFHATLRAGSGAEIEVGYGARPAIAPGLLLRMSGDADAPRVETVLPFLALMDNAGIPDGGGATARIAANLGIRLGVRGEPIPLGAGALPGFDTIRLGIAAGGSVRVLPAFAMPPAAMLEGLQRTLRAEGRRLRPDEHVALLGPALPDPPRAGDDLRLTLAIGDRRSEVVVRFR